MVFDGAEDGSSVFDGLRRHTIYYDDTVVFKVESTLFRVPKKGFSVPGNSLPVTIPQDNESMIPGLTDSDPLELAEVSEISFEGFLSVMYPVDGVVARYDNLVGALDLATLWRFKEIREKAISQLSRILEGRNVIEKIMLAKKYRVKRWLRDGYIKLAKQDDLTIEGLRCPGLELDWETISRIFALQQKERSILLFKQNSKQWRWPRHCGRGVDANYVHGH
ncbi:hypothetical protein BDZ97DRAFT_1364998 [Flammula alnicola]|nr:hypothetical protein BDZ97DRAFT_1364998 [Flammula alnicola]